MVVLISFHLQSLGFLFDDTFDPVNEYEPAFKDTEETEYKRAKLDPGEEEDGYEPTTPQRQHLRHREGHQYLQLHLCWNLVNKLRSVLALVKVLLRSQGPQTTTRRTSQS